MFESPDKTIWIYPLISNDFQHGPGLSMGELTIIEPDVAVGKNVKIGHRVTLKSGTRVGDDAIIDDHSITTGACIIGNKVNIRTGAIISRGTVIEDLCFIGPGVVTNHTKHVVYGRESTASSSPLITYISYGSIIGSQASILAGIYVGPQTIVGGGAVGASDIPDGGIYVGSPWKLVSRLPEEFIIKDMPENAGRMYADPSILEHMLRYMPTLNIQKLLNQIACYETGSH